MGSPAPWSFDLWHALDQQLLCPFEYYACDDETDSLPRCPGSRRARLGGDLRGWSPGNHVRARLVLDEWRRLAGDPARGRALLFCVSVAHAQDMTARLNRAGIKALCVVGDTPTDERRRAPRTARTG